MRNLVIFASLLATVFAAPSGLLHAAVPAATYLASPVEYKTVEYKAEPVEVEVAEAPVYTHAVPQFGYAHGAAFPGYAHAVAPAAVEVKAVEVAETPVVAAAPVVPAAPVVHAAPVPYAAHHTSVETKYGAPYPVQAGPTQKITHYGTVPQVTGYTSTIHKPSIVAPRIGVPTTLLNKVQHNPAEVTVEKYDVNVQQVEPNPVPYKVPVAGAPIYENTHIKHEPIIKTHTNVHHTAVHTPVVHAAPVAHTTYTAHAVPAVHHAGYAAHAVPAYHGAPVYHGVPATYAVAEEKEE